MKFKYKVKTVGDVPALADGTIIPGVGIIKGGSVESNFKIENPDLELISGGEEPAQTHLNGVVSQTAQPIAPTQATESEKV